MDISVRLALALILSVIEAAFKNPAKKAVVKKYLLALRDQITLLYPEEFEGLKGRKAKPASIKTLVKELLAA